MSQPQQNSVSAPPTATDNDHFLLAPTEPDVGSSVDTTRRSSMQEEAVKEEQPNESINEEKVIAAASPRRRKRALIITAVALAIICLAALIVPLAVLLPSKETAPTVVLTLKGSPTAQPPATDGSDDDGSSTSGAAPAAPTTPPVSVVVTGVNQGGYEEYRGLRYAMPPVGDLRFALPRDLPGNMIETRSSSSSNGNAVAATKFGPVCAQGGDANQQDEDCLYLNIVRPAGVQAQPLPVLFFIHGGGFESGAGSRFAQGARSLLQAGQRSGAPAAIVVTFNYRLGLLGFLGGSQMDSLKRAGKVGSNLGFQDMRKALEWTARNIADFGGDAKKITIWGQSAGAFGVGALLLGSPPSINDTDVTPLFKAAILQSGGPGGVPINAPRFKDPQFARVLEQAKCQRASAQEQLQCLRAVPWKALRDISTGESVRARGPEAIYILGSYPWTPQLDGGPTQGGFYSSRPSVVLQNGDFAKVPLITGDVEDEGTLFAPRNLNSDLAVLSYFQSIYFSNTSANVPASMEALQSMLHAYPNDPRVGSPYSSRNPDDRYFGSDNQFKRVASLYGDIRFQSNRRFLTAQAVAENVTVRSYQFADHPDGGAMGVPHGSDVDTVFQSNSKSPLASIMARQWLNFAASSDPNGPGLPSWPEYGTDKRLLSYHNGGATVIPDTFRQAAMEALLTDDFLQLTGR